MLIEPTCPPILHLICIEDRHRTSRAEQSAQCERTKEMPVRTRFIIGATSAIPMPGCVVNFVPQISRHNHAWRVESDGVLYPTRTDWPIRWRRGT